jgi:homoserine kinase type II
MAVYTDLSETELSQVVQDYGFVRLTGSRGIRSGSVNTHYLLETGKGKFFLKVDEIKSEGEVKREIDLLLFLRKHGFPCPEPVPDRKGRHYRDCGGKCLSLYRYIDGHVLGTKHAAAQIENAGRALAALHGIGKAYKKGIENRFNFERVAHHYGEVRTHLPAYFKKIIRTLDDEVDYLHHYLEGKLPKGIIHGDLFADNLAFVAGYESLRTLSLAEWDAFPNELRFSAFRFTVTRLKDFFLNPVDDRRRVNKDFREFYDRLRILRRERDGGMEGLLMAMATGYDYRKYQRVKALEKKGS